MNAGWQAFGQEVAQLRTKAGVSLEELCRATKIRKPLLVALESGRFEELPPPVFVAGYLQAIATRLGADGNALATRYRTLVEGRRPASDEAPAPVVTPPARGGRRRWGVVLWPVFAVALLAGAAVWFWLAGPRTALSERWGHRGATEEPAVGAPSSVPGQTGGSEAGEGASAARPTEAGSTEEAAPAGPGGAAPVPAQPGPEPSGPSAPVPSEAGPPEKAPAAVPGGAAPVPAQPGPEPSGPSAPAAGVPARPQAPAAAESTPEPSGDLVIIASKDCWTVLSAGDRRVLSREIKAGERLAFSGAAFRATFGDASAVEVLWHGRPLPLPREAGRVLRDVPIPGPATPGGPTP